MSKHCKYGRRATSNTEAMTTRMAATFTGIKRHKIEKHRAGKCACTNPLEQGQAMSRCVFHRIREQFDSEDNAALEQLLNTSSHITVARIMTSAGYRMSEHTVRRHKKRDCMCEQVAV